MKSIIITEAFGGYYKVVKNILEKLGLQVLTLDEAPSKSNDCDFCNFESVMHLSSDHYAIWALGERSISEIMRLGPENFPNPIMTTMTDIMSYIDKVKCRSLLPAQNALIQYPKIYSTSDFKKVIIKKRIGAGANYNNGRLMVADLSKSHYIVEFIEHDKELMIIANYHNGKLVDWIPYVNFVDDDRNTIKPCVYPDELTIDRSVFLKVMHKWLTELGEKNHIDGLIDVGFMYSSGGNILWFIESNPRANRESYNIAQPMVYDMLMRKLPKSFLFSDSEGLNLYENSR